MTAPDVLHRAARQGYQYHIVRVGKAALNKLLHAFYWD
jgi:hypothetical protein